MSQMPGRPKKSSDPAVVPEYILVSVYRAIFSPFPGNLITFDTYSPPLRLVYHGADRKGSDNMSEKQKQLVEDITSNIEKLPIEKQYQLLGVAQGMGMTPQPQAAKAEEK